MKENINKNHPKPTPPMDTITTKVVRLKIAKGCRHTSAMEKLWRAIRGKDSLNTLGPSVAQPTVMDIRRLWRRLSELIID